MNFKLVRISNSLSLAKTKYSHSRIIANNLNAPTLVHSHLVTTPAPIVRPPSRTANRKPGLIAIGNNKLHEKVALSPGITI